MSGYPGGSYSGGQHHGGGGYGPPQGGYPPQQAPYPYQGQGGYPPQGQPPPNPNYRPPPNPNYRPPPSPQPPQWGGQLPASPGYGGYPPPNRPVSQGYGQGHGGYPPQNQGPPQGYGPGPGGQRPHPVTVNTNAYMQGNHSAPPPPPQGFQNFGHGAPSGYGFQYSNCTGRRKALLIGINYFNQRGQLRGCINDVKNLSTYLNQNFGYAREDMVILTDDQRNPMSQPTRQNIIRAMHWLVKDAKQHDSLFFHYSGHGDQIPDTTGDEDDGYDEVICPVDFKQAGVIVDDEMHAIMVKPLQPGVRLTAIFDSCHSGTALDLPYIYSTQGVLKEPNLAKEAGMGLLSAISSYSKGDLGGIASTAIGLFKKATTGEDVRESAMRTKTSPADVIMWSGSKDDQTSRDAQIAGQATGAMSWAFITALKKNPQQSYVQLLNSIRDELAREYKQKPQLSCSHPLDVDLLYVM